MDESDYVAPVTPDCGMDDSDVENTVFEYSTRHPLDWVISGPRGELGSGPGRRFATVKLALAWATGKYGARLKWRIREASNNGGNRWAYLIDGRV